MSTRESANPWVSILTPVANGWEYLEQCAESVFSQILRVGDVCVTCEWLVGINGHGETGGEAMKTALRLQRSKDGGELQMRVVNLPGVKGKVAAMNELVALSRGEWVAILDCDDTWEPYKLVAQKGAIESQAKGAGVVGTLCWYFGEWVSAGPDLPLEWVPHAAFKEGNPIINSSAILKRDYALWSDTWWGLDDYDMWLRLNKGGVKFYNVPLRLVNHRIHGASAFNASGKQDIKGLQRSYFKESEADNTEWEEKQQSSPHTIQ